MCIRDSLKGEWAFIELDENASKITLDMDFIFDNQIAHKVFSGIFQKVVNTQFEAFQQRAHSLYAVK